jgi:hypothetical protein
MTEFDAVGVLRVPAGATQEMATDPDDLPNA